MTRLYQFDVIVPRTELIILVTIVFVALLVLINLIVDYRIEKKKNEILQSLLEDKRHE